MLEWFDQVLGAGLDEDGIPPQAAMLLDVGFAARRSPGLGAALGRGWAPAEGDLGQNRVQHRGPGMPGPAGGPALQLHGWLGMLVR